VFCSITATAGKKIQYEEFTTSSITGTKICRNNSQDTAITAYSRE